VKNRAFFSVNLVAARMILGPQRAAAGHEEGSRRSYVRTDPRKVTVRSDPRINPATEGSARHALALTERREVVVQTAPPSATYTSGVTWGPNGVRTAR
jgi:hypothetical protein